MRSRGIARPQRRQRGRRTPQQRGAGPRPADGDEAHDLVVRPALRGAHAAAVAGARVAVT